MAIIVTHHTVAMSLDVDPDNNPDLIEGQFTMLDANNYAVGATGEAGTVSNGVVGDSSESSSGHKPPSADLVINPAGGTRGTSNRVNDFYNETSGSAKITVYVSGGVFWTDQFDATDEYSPGSPLYVDANHRVSVDASANNQVVGICTAAPQSYPSGVPGTDIDGSTSLGTFLQFQQVLYIDS